MQGSWSLSQLAWCVGGALLSSLPFVLTEDDARLFPGSFAPLHFDAYALAAALALYLVADRALKGAGALDGARRRDWAGHLLLVASVVFAGVCAVCELAYLPLKGVWRGVDLFSDYRLLVSAAAQAIAVSCWLLSARLLPVCPRARDAASADGAPGLDMPTSALMVAGLAGVVVVAYYVSLFLVDSPSLGWLTCLIAGLGALCLLLRSEAWLVLRAPNGALCVIAGLLLGSVYLHVSFDSFLGNPGEQAGDVMIRQVASLPLFAALLGALVLGARSIRRRDEVGTPKWACGDVRLSGREGEVITRLLAGDTLSGVANSLGISVSAVGTYRSRAFSKLGISDLSELKTAPGAPEADCREGRMRRLLRVSPFMLLLVMWLDVLFSSETEMVHRLACALSPLVLALFLLLPRKDRALTQPSEAFGAAVVICWVYLLCQIPARPPLPLWTLALLAPFFSAPCALSSAMSLGASVPLSQKLGRALHLMLPSSPQAAGAVTSGCLLAELAASSCPAGLITTGTVACWATMAALSIFVSLVTIRSAKLARNCATKRNGARQVFYLMGRGLSESQAQVALMTADGIDRSRIAEKLCLSPGTVSSYRAFAYRALGVHSREELAELLKKDAGRDL